MTKLMEKISTLTLATALTIGSAASVGAGEVNTSAEFADYLKRLSAGTQSQKNVYAPGVMHATVAPHGTGFVGLNLFTPRGGNPAAGADGSLSTGVGFGDMDNGIGASLVLNTTGLVPFGTDGDFTLKIARTVYQQGANKTTIGAQANRIAAWGSNATQPKSFDFALTHVGSLPGGNGGTPYIATIGYGTHNGVNGVPGSFAAFGVGLTEALGVGVSVKAGAVNAGIGYKVAQVPGMSLSFDLSNINRSGPAASNAMVVSFGINFSKANLFGRK